MKNERIIYVCSAATSRRFVHIPIHRLIKIRSSPYGEAQDVRHNSRGPISSNLWSIFIVGTWNAILPPSFTAVDLLQTSRPRDLHQLERQYADKWRHRHSSKGTSLSKRRRWVCVLAACNEICLGIIALSTSCIPLQLGQFRYTWSILWLSVLRRGLRRLSISNLNFVLRLRLVRCSNIGSTRSIAACLI
jgi:hypothetical protein